MLYALVSPAGEILEFRPYDVEPQGLSVADNKPRLLPVVEVRPPFNPATQVAVDPVDTVQADKVQRLYGVRAKYADDLAAERAAKIAAIKAEASRRILIDYPIWKQLNLTARAVALTDLSLQRELTPEEEAERAQLRADYAATAAIRTRSDELEAAVPATAQALHDFDPMAGWD